MTLEEVERLLNLDNRFEQYDEDKNNIIQDRDIDGKIHPSGVGGCEKKLWYALLMTEPRHLIPPKLRRTFEHGTAIHEWIQEKIPKMFGPDCGITLEIEKKITYTEIAQEFNIAGSADGLFTIHRQDQDDVRIVYEIKSISNEGWGKLGKKPQPKHIIQATIYAKCFDAQFICFDYYNKDADEHKRMIIEPSEEAWTYVTTVIARLFEHLAQGTSPQVSKNRWECKTCMYYYTCRPERNQ